MKRKTIAILLTAVMLLAATAGVALAGNGLDTNGNHYNLNIIGVQNPKTADMDSSNGHVIFVPLSGKCQINLTEPPEGATYNNILDACQVLDANATDGPALLQLPKPGLDPYLIGGDMDGVDTVSDYSVYVRSLGKPGGFATITTCAELLDSNFAGLLSGEFLRVLNRNGEFGGSASIEQVGQEITMRDKGKSSFTNVTAQLLTIVFKVEVQLADGSIAIDYVRVPIFSDIIQGEYWEYDNNGLKLLQVRFYPVGTDVSEADLLLP